MVPIIAGSYKGLQIVERGQKMLQRDTRGYRGSLEVTERERVKKGFRGFNGLLGVTGVTRGQNGIQGAIRGFRGLQGVTGGYKEFEKVTRG